MKDRIILLLFYSSARLEPTLLKMNIKEADKNLNFKMIKLILKSFKNYK